MDDNEPTPAEETTIPVIDDPESKADLIHYAISHGEAPAVAVSMTKNELTAKYGEAFGHDAVLSAEEVISQIQVRWVCPVCGLTACHHNLAYVIRES